MQLKCLLQTLYRLQFRFFYYDVWIQGRYTIKGIDSFIIKNKRLQLQQLVYNFMLIKRKRHIQVCIHTTCTSHIWTIHCSVYQSSQYAVIVFLCCYILTVMQQTIILMCHNFPLLLLGTSFVPSLCCKKGCCDHPYLHVLAELLNNYLRRYFQKSDQRVHLFLKCLNILANTPPEYFYQFIVLLRAYRSVDSPL